MRPNHPMQLHSALLARPSTLFTQSNGPVTAGGAAATCIMTHKLQQSRSMITLRFSTTTSPSQSKIHIHPPRSRVLIQSKPLQQRRNNSTISANPPPPSTSNRARKSQQTYTPPGSTSSSSSSPKSPQIETASSPDPTLSYAAPMHPSQTHPPQSIPLTWDAFLSLRKTRRRYNLFASLSTSLLTTSAGISVLAQQNIESAGLFGLDPFVVLGLATAGSGAVGWLMGPFVGNGVFAMAHRSRRGEIAEKERDLYRRIKQHRVDPSSSSAGNPVPDYYGEKIGSVAEYRTWMKDQRAYNKRRQNFL